MKFSQYGRSVKKASITAGVFVFFIVSLQLFRVDLSAGKFGFIFSPNLLAMILLFLLVLLQKKMRFDIGLKSYFYLALLIIIYSVIRVIPIQDVLQLKRVVLFIFAIISSMLIYSCLLIEKNNEEPLFLQSIKYTILVYVILSIIQIIYFVKGEHYDTGLEPFSFIELLPRTIGPFFPRLTGGFIDPNVCGYYFTFLFYLTFIYNLPKWYRYLFVLIILLTLSRSAIATLAISYFLLIGINMLKDFRSITLIKRTKLIGFGFLICLTSISFILISDVIISYFQNALQARLSDPGSTRIHMSLFDLAYNEITRDISSLLIGKGFSTSFIYTSEIFGNNKYGNFHSEYITILFELGAIGFIMYSLIFLIPTIYLLFNFNKVEFSSILLVILASIFLQNIFYQQYMFFYYWIILAFIWFKTFTGHKSHQLESHRSV